MLAREIEVVLPELHSGQLRVLDEAARFNVLECGRRFGKTVLGQELAGTAALENGHPVAWISPTYKLLAEVWRDMRGAYSGVLTEVSEQEKRLGFLGGGSIDFWSIERPDAGRGRKYARIILDEAGIARNLKDAWEGALRPTLTDLKGDAWFLGTPRGRNYFHHLFQLGQSGEPGWKSWRLSTLDNPYIDPDEIEEARRLLPEHVFRQEFCGEPADDGGNPFGLDAIARCVAPLSSASPVCFGVDLAKSQDWTVIVGLDASGRCCRFERFQIPWTETLRRVASACANVRTLVDSTGVGDPILEQLQRGGQGRFYEGFKFSASSKQQLMDGLAVAIQGGTVAFPDGPIRHELESFEYEFTRTGVRYEAPAGLHDDCVMALALAVSLNARPRGLSCGLA